MTDVCRQRGIRQNRIESRYVLKQGGEEVVFHSILETTDPKRGFQQLAEVIFNGPIQQGRRSGEEILADEREVKQVVLVQMREYELENVEVKIISGNHRTRLP